MNLKRAFTVVLLLIIPLSLFGEKLDSSEAELIAHVAAMVSVKEKFIYNNLKHACPDDFEQFCPDAKSIHELLNCIREKRDSVSAVCEEQMAREYGSKPFARDTTYWGVTLPKGSYFFYSSNGAVLGAITSDVVTFKGMQFKPGQVRLCSTGVASAGLLEDTEIKGIRYKADALTVFFDGEGNVSTAVLAENVIINGINYKGGRQIWFCNGDEVRSGFLAEDALINGEQKKAGEYISMECERQAIPPQNGGGWK